MMNPTFTDVEKNVLVVKVAEVNEPTTTRASAMRKPVLLAIGLGGCTIATLLAFYFYFFSGDSGNASSAASNSNSSFGNLSVSSKIAQFEWRDCNPVSDTCPSDFTCCVAPWPADIAANKATCRRAGLAANAPEGCAADQLSSSTPATTSGPSTSGPSTLEWRDCNPVSDTCPSDFTCCVAPSPADIAANKATCRRAGLAANAPEGCAADQPSSSTPATTSAYPLTPDLTCGRNTGYSCPESFSCCSTYGWCGNSDAYCGYGTQTEYAFNGALPAAWENSAPSQEWSRNGNSGSSQSPAPSEGRYASFTNYDPSTGPAYCNGVWYNSGDMVVAMSSGILFSNNACGRRIAISANGRTVYATVVDQCSESHGCRSNNIDGVAAVWYALGIDISIGVYSVAWSFA